MRFGSYIAKIHFEGHFELILRSFSVEKVINYKVWNKGAFANTSLTSELEAFLRIWIDSELNTLNKLIIYYQSRPSVRGRVRFFIYLAPVVWLA